jgi:hypothetical protein
VRERLPRRKSPPSRPTYIDGAWLRTTGPSCHKAEVAVSAGYRIVNPGSDRLTEPGYISRAHADRQSLGRLNDRAAVGVAIWARRENIGSSKAFQASPHLMPEPAERDK